MAKSALYLYFHFPFCRSKCHFCFKVYEIEKRQLLNQSLYGSYCDALLECVDAHAPILARTHQAAGLAWGGGTPSLIPPSDLRRLHRRLTQYWDIEGLANTFEMTPETVSVELLELLLDCGVNRISLGAQTFNDETLRKMGRIHRAEDVHQAVKKARSVGMANFNIDLIVTLPGESLEDLERSLNEIEALQPPHLTTYFYNPTPGTVLFDQIRTGRNVGWTLAQHQDAIDLITCRLEAAGYRNYEFFHWSLDPDAYSYAGLDHYFGHQGDLFGFGAGAQSFMAPLGCQQFPEMPKFLENPSELLSGKFDFAYALERALGSRVGLVFSNLARAFGMGIEEVRHHDLVGQLRSIPGIIQTDTGLSLPPDRYFTEYARGVASRFHQIASGERAVSFA